MVLPESGDDGGGRRLVILDLDFAPQIVQHVAIMLFGEEADDVGRHVLADAVDVVELAPRLALGVGGVGHRLAPARERAVVARQELRRRLADLRDAERIDEAVERDAAPRVDRVDELLGARLAPALARLEVRGIEPEDIRWRAHELVFPEGLHVLLAHALDVEGIARHEMLEPLDRLRRADEAAGAAPRRFALLAHRKAAAFGAFRAGSETARLCAGGGSSPPRRLAG